MLNRTTGVFLGHVTVITKAVRRVVYDLRYQMMYREVRSEAGAGLVRANLNISSWEEVSEPVCVHALPDRYHPRSVTRVRDLSRQPPSARD
ncbi:hypothetical protein RRG08_062043 [Elysia crispata]|uniref:Uncharacterized protein n=1 Tax=Elysia crispata TaxID=231223 RepID=A0AAE1DRT6_9GAST|nr:hypothetical protein RRG08_062043 [Elysia crispata]